MNGSIAKPTLASDTIRMTARSMLIGLLALSAALPSLRRIAAFKKSWPP